MPIRDALGNRLYRRVEVRILYPENVLKPEHIIQRASAGKGISEDGVGEILMQIADKLDSLYPWWEFEPIEVDARHPTISKHVFSFKGYATKPQIHKREQ